MFKKFIDFIKSIFKHKQVPMGTTIIPNATVIQTDDETNPLDVDLLKGNIKNTKKLRQSLCTLSLLIVNYLLFPI